MSLPVLCDPANPPPVEAVDQVVLAMQGPDAHAVMTAAEQLDQFRMLPDAYMRAYDLLTKSRVTGTRMLALQLVEAAVMTRWNVMPDEERAGVRAVVMECITEECTSMERLRANKALVTKMNATLVAIAKREWPARWPSFVRDVIAQATSALQTQPAVVENTIALLGILGEEVFEFGERSMTRRWVERKRVALAADFSEIAMFCLTQLERATDPQTVALIFSTLQRFVPFVDTALIFREDVLSYISGLTEYDAVRAPAMRYLTEVVSLPPQQGAVGMTQRGLLSAVFATVLDNIAKALPTNHESIELRINAAFGNGGNRVREEMTHITLFVTTLLRHHLKGVKHDRLRVEMAHRMLVGLSHLEDKELFKTCIDYWYWLAAALRTDSGLGGVAAQLGEVFKNVRFMLIRRMPKPEEILFVEEESGELRPVLVEDIESLELYKQVRDTLVLFARMDPDDTVAIMTTLMGRQRDYSEWSWSRMNTLCWSIGSIAGAVDAQCERDLFMKSITVLLEMCGEMRGTANRAVIAANVMYIVGQNDRYLLSHTTFFKVVCRRLFYFMSETFEGVQEMAVDTLLKLSTRVPECFAVMDAIDGAAVPFVEVVIRSMDSITAPLSPPHKEVFWEALGNAVRALTDVDYKKTCITAMMSSVDAQLRQGAEVAVANVAASAEVSYLRELIALLRLHVAVSKSVGPAYFFEISEMFAVFEGFYRHYFTIAGEMIASGGPNAVNSYEMRLIRTVKKEVMRIFQHFITDTNDIRFVTETCLTPILDLVVTDYRDSLPGMRDAGVFGLITACLNKLQGAMAGLVDGILGALFDPTVAMIGENLVDFPEHRTGLFLLINALCVHCFDSLLVAAGQKTAILDVVLWAIKHTDNAVQTTALETLLDFISKVAQSASAEDFFTLFSHRIIIGVLSAAFDKLHAAALPHHARILTAVFGIVSTLPPDMPTVGPNAVAGLVRSTIGQIESVVPEQIDAFVAYSIGPAAITKPDDYARMLQDFLIEVEVWGAAQENQEAERLERAGLEQMVPGLKAQSHTSAIRDHIQSRQGE